MAEHLSQRGKPKLAHNGVTYVFDKLNASQTTEFWRCSERGQCKARLHRRGEEIIKIINNHTHDSQAPRINAEKVVAEIKQRAVQTQECTSQVINECTSGLCQATMVTLPQMGAIKKMVRRKRNQIHHAPPAPQSLEMLEIPEEFKIYNSGGLPENFLLADSGPGPDRILVFGRDTNLRLLSESVDFYMDGTFKTAPLLFSQIYTILGKKFGGVHPIVYALLPNKQKTTYVRLFHILKKLQPHCRPTSFSIDYEAAAIQAIKECFPEVEIRGCFYHLTHNLRKQMCTLGIIHRYNTEEEFFKILRLLQSFISVGSSLNSMSPL